MDENLAFCWAQAFFPEQRLIISVAGMSQVYRIPPFSTKTTYIMCGRSSVTKSEEKRMFSTELATNELAENNNFPRASRFFAHFFADTARLREKTK